MTTSDKELTAGSISVSFGPTILPVRIVSGWQWDVTPGIPSIDKLIEKASESKDVTKVSLVVPSIRLREAFWSKLPFALPAVAFELEMQISCVTKTLSDEAGVDKKGIDFWFSVHYIPSVLYKYVTDDHGRKQHGNPVDWFDYKTSTPT